MGVSVLLILHSELAAACGAGQWPASSMVQHTFRCRQTKPEINLLFAVCGFSINVTDLFVFAGTNEENPIPEFDTKI